MKYIVHYHLHFCTTFPTSKLSLKLLINEIISGSLTNIMMYINLSFVIMLNYIFIPPDAIWGLVWSHPCQVISCPSGQHFFVWARTLNSLPHNKFLDWFKLKAFADYKIKVIEKLKFNLGRVENTVGKGENAGYQHFLLFLQCFQKASFTGVSKVGTVW